MRLTIQHGARVFAELRVLEPEALAKDKPEPGRPLEVHPHFTGLDGTDWAGLGFTHAAN